MRKSLSDEYVEIEILMKLRIGVSSNIGISDVMIRDIKY